MKKLTALCLTLTLTCSLAACSHPGSESSTFASQPNAESTAPAPERTQKPSEQPSEAPTQAPTEAPTTEPEANEGKTLVVYYSATGNTEEVATAIAAVTGADVFELEPVEPYSSDDLNWRDENSRVVYEHNHPGARLVELVASTVPDWEAYDTVLIGYPIWWGIAAWPVDGFVEANDFTGKTVIPFCTSSSSDLGESGKLLAEAAGTGTWLEGQRFSSSASAEAVQAWIEDLGF